MIQAILYGFLGAIALFGGAVCGSFFKVKPKIIGVIMAFGAGALIAALSFGLLEEAHSLAGLIHTIWAFVFGGMIFAFGDYLIINLGGRGHKRVYDTEKTSSSGWAIVLAATLDGIPESLALGVALLLGKSLGLLMVIAIFVSNFPEGISSAYDLLRAGFSKKKILLTWLVVALIGFIFVIFGYTVFGHIAPAILGITEAIAAGALLAMIASTMMPESFQESGLLISMATILGFITIFILAKMNV